jgi:small multidrug resistance pump
MKDLPASFADPSAGWLVVRPHYPEWRCRSSWTEAQHNTIFPVFEGNHRADIEPRHRRPDAFGGFLAEQNVIARLRQRAGNTRASGRHVGPSGPCLSARRSCNNHGNSMARFGWLHTLTLASETEMKNRTLAVIVTIAFSIVGVVGDYLLKRASEQTNPMQSRWFYIGFVVYASTAFGWVFVMRHLKLATIGVVYSVSMILLLMTVGIVFFREPLNRYEVLGLAMAVASLILLIRFA